MNTVNLNCFIVPNDGMRFNLFLDCLRKSMKKDLNNIGIVPEDTDDMIQVWISAENEDNCSDHGFPDDILKTLGLEDESRFDRRCPKFLPYSILKDVKEGDVKQFVAPNGAMINIKFEQLPYRYRRFGTFEETLNYVYYKTQENNKFQEKLNNKKGA